MVPVCPASGYLESDVEFGRGEDCCGRKAIGHQQSAFKLLGDLQGKVKGGIAAFYEEQDGIPFVVLPYFLVELIQVVEGLLIDFQDDILSLIHI